MGMLRWAVLFGWAFFCLYGENGSVRTIKYGSFKTEAACNATRIAVSNLRDSAGQLHLETACFDEA